MYKSLVISVLLVCGALPASAASPHPHPSVLKPITAAPAAIALNTEEESEIRSGEAILRQTQGEDGGRGVAVQLVSAPATAVWDTILAYDKYTKWVDDVVKCEVYQREGDKLFVAMTSSFMWIKSSLFTINDVQREQGYMSWVLDRTRESDVKDMIGYWRIEQIQADPPLTRLDYATEIVVSGVPDFIVKHLTESSLVDGTAWVKREAEKSWATNRPKAVKPSPVDAGTTSSDK